MTDVDGYGVALVSIPSGIAEDDDGDTMGFNAITHAMESRPRGTTASWELAMVTFDASKFATKYDIGSVTHHNALPPIHTPS